MQDRPVIGAPLGGCVEWVAERIDVGGYYTKLARFGTVRIANPSSAYAGNVYPLANSTAYDMRSCNGATLLASTGAYHTTPLPVLRPNVEGLRQQREGLLTGVAPDGATATA